MVVGMMEVYFLAVAVFLLYFSTNTKHINKIFELVFWA